MSDGLYFLLITTIYLICFLVSHSKQDKEFQSEREKWHTERQQLLDRIQSPSFAEYKHQEVRVIKAQNNEKEPPKLEVL